jgi:hypothetical protein
MPAAPLIDFAGKVLHVYLKAGTIDAHGVSQYGVANPRFEEVAGRVFLVGDSIDFEDIPMWKGIPIWHAGATLGILWEAVGCYLVFESASAYKRALVANAEQQAQVGRQQPTPNTSGFWPFRRG